MDTILPILFYLLSLQHLIKGLTHSRCSIIAYGPFRWKGCQDERIYKYIWVKMLYSLCVFTLLHFMNTSFPQNPIGLKEPHWKSSAQLFYLWSRVLFGCCSMMTISLTMLKLYFALIQFTKQPTFVFSRLHNQTRQLNPKQIYLFGSSLSQARYPYSPGTSHYYDTLLSSFFTLPNSSQKSVAFFSILSHQVDSFFRCLVIPVEEAWIMVCAQRE